MVRPVDPEHRELHLDVRVVRGEEEQAQEEDVVEGDIRGLDLAPRERRRLANHPDKAGAGGQADSTGDGPRPDLPVVLRDEEPDAGRQEEDPDVEERPDLEADGDELPSGHAVEEGVLPAGEGGIRSQAGDRAHDVGIHVAASPAVQARRRAPALSTSAPSSPRASKTKPVPFAPAATRTMTCEGRGT